MAEKLIIVMANTDPRNTEELGAPFFQATVAGLIDMSSMVDNSTEENLYYLGALEAGDTGSSVLGFVVS